MRPDQSQPNPDDPRDVAWRPRAQSPAASYSSLRHFRDQATTEHQALTGPQPIVTPQPPLFGHPRPKSRPQTPNLDALPDLPFLTEPDPISDPLVTSQDDSLRPHPTFQMPATEYVARYVPASDRDDISPTAEVTYAAPDEPRLPHPGAPLFGPRGLMSQPLSRPATAEEPPDFITAMRAAIAPVSQPMTTGKQRKVMPARATDPSASQTSLPKIAPQTEAKTERLTGPQITVNPTTPAHVPGYPRARFSWDELKRLTQNRSSAIVTAIVGLVLLSVMIVRPLTSSAHSGGTGDFSADGFGSSSASQINYAPMALDTDHPPPVVWAESAVVMDETNGNVLFAKNPDEQLPMASTTKMMTAIVALSHAKLDDWFTITQDSADTGGSRMVLHTGERYNLRELLYAALLPSDNDAAEAIADGVGGNVDTFVRWMNETATALGLTHTHFVNPHGLPAAGHYSSAHDLAVLGRYALSIPAIHEISQAHAFTITATKDHPKHYLENMHQPLFWYPGADGGKPGWTSEAQFVDVLSASRNGHHLIAVLMHGKNDWVTDIRDLLNWGFDDFSWVSPKDILSHQYIPFPEPYSYFNWDTPDRTITDGARRYYPYTGYSISGSFMSYYDQHGGLGTFGYPRSIPAPAVNGQLSQKFDNATITCNSQNGQCSAG